MLLHFQRLYSLKYTFLHQNSSSGKTLFSVGKKQSKEMPPMLRKWLTIWMNRKEMIWNGEEAFPQHLGLPGYVHGQFCNCMSNLCRSHCFRFLQRGGNVWGWTEIKQAKYPCSNFKNSQCVDMKAYVWGIWIWFSLNEHCFFSSLPFF